MRRTLFTTVAAIITFGLLLTESVSAHPAWGIAVDRQGQVYFSDLKTIWKLDAQNRLSVFRASVGDRHTHDLNIDEAGNLYGADNAYEPATQRFFSAVWKMTPAGGFSYLLAPTNNPPLGTSVWRDREGNSYHATYYPGRELLVLKRTLNGNVTALVGSSNVAREYRQGVPYSLGGMAFGADGALYFTHGAGVSRVATSGAVTALARNLLVETTSGASAGVGSPTQLFGIAVDAQGNALVADYGNRRMLKLTPDHKTITLLRAEEFWFPTGVAVRGDEIYSLESGYTPSHTPLGTRVRKLSPDGTVTVLATVGDSEQPSAQRSANDGNIERVSAPEHSAVYAFLGAGAGIFALAFVVWVVQKRMFRNQPQRN